MIVSGEYAICDKCIAQFGNLIQDHFPVKKNSKKPTLPSPVKLKSYLDQYVVGQEPAKIALCVSIANHYKRMLYEHDNEISKSNLLIAGPTGSGKSLLVSTVAKFLNVPYISVDVTSLTEAGYVGQNIDTIISRLLVEANGDINLAENGIIFLDEIDKIASGKSRNPIADGKVSGIQSGLLKIIEGTKVAVPFGMESMKKMVRAIEVDTSNILFIAGGAFVGLDEIVKRRLKKKSGIGFSDTQKEWKNLENEYTTDDFIEYGLEPEFMGRFPMRTYTTELTEKELATVFGVKNSILDEYKFYFNVDGIDLDFSSDFIQRVVQKARHEKTGVRGLKAICESIITTHLYLIPEYQKRNVAKLTFTGDCLDKETLPRIEIFQKTLKKLDEKSVL
ncbi:ATP-dependent Clp protease ATP-binding subunit ClpX [uncultured archaeon]|nr:ATP-dependent Clp protease ATP-binding subunit ClpX [uncultured archaeon]